MRKLGDGRNLSGSMFRVCINSRNQLHRSKSKTIYVNSVIIGKVGKAKAFNKGLHNDKVKLLLILAHRELRAINWNPHGTLGIQLPPQKHGNRRRDVTVSCRPVNRPD